MFQNSFNRLGQISGITYQYIPQDDGVAINTVNNGVAGVRPDIRIGGTAFTGLTVPPGANFFGFNQSPGGGGDMVIDTQDILNGSLGTTLNFGPTAMGPNATGLNLVMHEAVHGLGLDHVITGTGANNSNGQFLMEPAISAAFLGPQFDDILGLHQLYGDVNEKSNGGLGNNTSGNATPLGGVSAGMPIQVGTDAATTVVASTDMDFVSIAGADTDYYSFTTAGPTDVSLTLTPLGPTYNQGPQTPAMMGMNGPPYVMPTPFTSANQRDLTVTLRAPNGTTILTSSNLNGLGGSEVIGGFPLGTGTFFAQVTGGPGFTQMYQLDIAATTTRVALDGGGNLVVTDTSGGSTDDTLTILSDVANSRYIILDPFNAIGTSIPGAVGSGGNSVTIPFAAVTGPQIIFNTLAGDDRLTVDFSLGTYSKEVVFNGGAPAVAPGDSLTLQNGPVVDLIQVNHLDSSSGSINVTGNSTIRYGGLEPVLINVTATDVELNYSGASETITVTEAASTAMVEVTSTAGETITVSDPLEQLTVRGGGGTNTVDVLDLTTGFEVFLDGTGGTTNADVDNLTVTGSAGDGLSSLNLATLDVDQSSFTGNSGDGVETDGTTGTVTLKGITATGNGADGLDADGDAIVTIDGGDWSSINVRNSAGINVLGTVDSDGMVTLESNGTVTVDGDLDASASTIAVLANKDGAGSQNFDMAAGSSFTTTNDTPSAVRISVNTLAGGSGFASLAEISAGTTPGFGGGRVTVDVEGGSIIDANLGDNNITAGNAILRAGAAMGILIEPIETTVSRLEGSGGSGFYLTNSGPLQIGGVAPLVTGVAVSAGDARIRASSPLTVAEDVNASGGVFLKADESAGLGDDLIVNGGVTVRAVTEDVILEAGDNLTLFATSLVEAPAGEVNLKVDCDNGDLGGQTALIAGVINSADGATLLGDSENDSFFVSAMGTGGLLIDGLGGDDFYSIQYPFGATFGSPISINDSVGGTDRVEVNGTAAGESLFFTTDGAPATPTTNVVGRGAANLEPVILDGTVEDFRLNAGDGVDTVTAQPSMLFPTLFDGGEPCFGDAGVPPGDKFIFDPLGNDIVLDPDTKELLVQGGMPNPFQPVSAINFEEFTFPNVGAGPVQQFDFNHTHTASSPATSPTQAGYTGVRPDDIFPGASGFGWQSEVASFERDDSFFATEFEPLVRDGHQLTAPATFSATVPVPGVYLVSLNHGDPYSDISNIEVVNADTGVTLVTGLSSLAGMPAQRSLFVTVPDTTLDLTFQNSPIHPEIFAINGLTIRPADVFTMGIDGTCGFFSALEANGATIDTFGLFDGPVNSLVTVTTSLGTIVNVDEDPELAGLQVRTDMDGEADILLQRPFSDGRAVIRAEAFDGTSSGCGFVEYILPSFRNFDFNHHNSTSSVAQSPTQDPAATDANPFGFIGVVAEDLYTNVRSFGWLTSPDSFDDGAMADPLGDLKRDGARDTVDRTFRVDLPPGIYKFTGTIGSNRDNDDVGISANGVPVLFPLVSTAANEHTQVEFLASTNPDGHIDLTFSDAGGASPLWVINGLQIRNAFTLTPITFGPPVGPVAADGVSVITVSATTTLADGEQVTVSSSVGTIVSADVNPDIDGVQVVVAGGMFSFDLQAPTNGGIPVLQAMSLDGQHEGSVFDSAFLEFTQPAVRRFDFNHTHSQSSIGPSPTTPGYVGVLRTDDDPFGDGFGWVTAPNSTDSPVANAFDQGDSNSFVVATTDLYRDSHSGHTSLGPGTFRVKVDPGVHKVQVTTGSNRQDQGVRVTVEGSAASQSLDTVARTFGSLAFLDADDIGGDGFLDITFEPTGTISPFWYVTGVDVADSGAALPLPAALAAAETQLESSVDSITSADLTPYITVATQAWKNTGLTAEETALIENVEFIVTDLDSIRALGLITSTDRVFIDDNGSGFGWNPLIDVSVSDRYDLLTVVAHELGHMLGHPDTSPLTSPGDLMNSILNVGARNDRFGDRDEFFSKAIDQLLPF